MALSNVVYPNDDEIISAPELSARSAPQAQLNSSTGYSEETSSVMYKQKFAFGALPMNCPGMFAAIVDKQYMPWALSSITLDSLATKSHVSKNCPLIFALSNAGKLV